MSKRILMLLGWYFLDSVGGTEVYVHGLGRKLQALGWEVMIAAASSDEKEQHYIYEGLPVFRYPVTLKPTKAELRGEIPPEYFDVFKNWLEKNKPDIVHMHSHTRGCGFYHAKFVKELGIPLCFSIHAADVMCVGGTALRWGEIPCDGKIKEYRCTACWIRKHKVPWFVAWILTFLPLWIADNIGVKMKSRIGTALSMRRLFLDRSDRLFILLDFVDKIILVSRWVKYVLILNGISEQKIFLRPHGLPIEPIDHNIKVNYNIHQPPCFGFVGRFNYVKGVHILIKAIKRLPKNLPVELRLYGRVNNQEEEIYFKWLKKLSKFDRRILFCSEVSNKNREEVFNSFDILAVPSIWFETGPYVVLEAFASGIPIIGSNLGGIAELVTDRVNGLLVETGDISAWTESLAWICEHPQILKDWASRIPPVRTLEEMVQEIHRVYTDILNR